VNERDAALRSDIEAAEEIGEIAGRNAGLNDAAEAAVRLVEAAGEGENPVAAERVAEDAL
jgi:hypothetical protein